MWEEGGGEGWNDKQTEKDNPRKKDKTSCSRVRHFKKRNFFIGLAQKKKKKKKHFFEALERMRLKELKANRDKSGLQGRRRVGEICETVKREEEGREKEVKTTPAIKEQFFVAPWVLGVEKRNDCRGAGKFFF